jgi:hypothetical protein
MTTVDTENKPKRKATRRIKKFDFSSEDATVSLVSEDQGGGANGFQTLITKSAEEVTEEDIKEIVISTIEKSEDKEVSSGDDTAEESESVEKSAEEVTSDNIVHEVEGEGKTSVVKQKKKENKPMTEKVQVIEQEVEVIAKAQFDEIQKAFDAQKEELQKALDLVNELKKEKQEAIAKARKEQLVEVAGDKAEVLFNACGEATDEIFADVVKALGEMKAQVEKSKMFEEVGASVEEDQTNESPIAKALQARLAKKQ